MTGGAQDSGVIPDGCPACGALPIDWAGGANPHAFCATPAPAGWQPIESAPRDGEGLLLTDGNFVHYGWWHGEGTHPWAMVDSHDMSPNGCCHNETDGTISPNGWTENGPTHWMPLPTAPAEGGV